MREVSGKELFRFKTCRSREICTHKNLLFEDLPKEVLKRRRKEDSYFLSQMDQAVGTRDQVQDHTARREEHSDVLQGKTDGSYPSDQQQTYDIEVFRELLFTVIPFKQGSIFVYQTKGHFKIPLKQKDVVKRTKRTMDVLLASRIDDCWNVDRGRELAVPWTVFSQFRECVCKTSSLNGYKVSPCESKASKEKARRLQKFFESKACPKVIYTNNTLELGKACEDLAHKPVCRVKEGTSAILPQSGLEKIGGLIPWNITVIRATLKTLSGGRTPYERRSGEPFCCQLLPLSR